MNKPWTYLDDGDGNDVEPPEPGKEWLTIYDAHENEVACLITRTGFPSSEQKKAECEANAAHIVHCVNTHEQLVDAIKHAINHNGEDCVLGHLRIALAAAKKGAE